MKKLFYLVAIMFLFGCGETYCPGFDEKNISLLFANENDNWCFVANHDTLNFNVKSVYMSQSETFDWNCDCECGYPYAELQTDTAQNGLYIQARVDISSSLIYEYTFHYKHLWSVVFSCEYDAKNNTFHEKNYVEIVNYNLNDKNLENVCEISDWHDEKFTKQIYFSPEYGLIAFVDEDGKEWKRVLE